MHYIAQKVPDALIAFENRLDAGVHLASFIKTEPGNNYAVLALPRGGIPVASPLADKLGVPLELALVRKLPIPYSPEAGFGAVALDGSLAINESLLSELRLRQDTVDEIIKEVQAEVERRAIEYVGNINIPDVEGKHVFVLDDGLASGYTIIAAAKMLKKQKPSRLCVAVPVSSSNTINTVDPYFDDIYCLLSQSGYPFAVASFYLDFHDLTDEEVKDILKKQI
jgi:putative phosphoribosyl transferase